MKLMNLLPVTADVMTPAIQEYIRYYLSPNTDLVMDQIKTGPASIECEFDEALAAPEVIKLCKKAEQDGCDGIFVNCFGDPGVRAARECVNIPVFGGFEPAMHLALGLGDAIGIVTVLPNVMPMIQQNVRRAGLGSRVVSVRSVDIPVLELSDTEILCDALVRECHRAIVEDGVSVLVLGCTGMVNVSERVRQELLTLGHDLPVVEAAHAALMLLELYAKLGLKHSRITYRPPVCK